MRSESGFHRDDRKNQLKRVDCQSGFFKTPSCGFGYSFCVGVGRIASKGKGGNLGVRFELFISESLKIRPIRPIKKSGIVRQTL